MSLPTRKVITLDEMLQSAELSSKEIEALYSDLAVDNYVPGNPFEIHIDITAGNQEDYEVHWRKILNMLINKHQCIYNETVIVVESY